ncbi:response regulator transcription factor [Paenibacillus camelliae]|uniref:response regulator transcription factor n=1 Tax=Paenibacillus camelliae TaxID=512410 RepID=UPI00203DCA7C|nr:response regulator [Paenibacillus camelliae]MCM3634301.1 response regulator [Paenibacillus camelliae]
MINILLVDDEPIVKIALRTMIDWESLGFHICGTASDGVEALALVKELQPHIIVTDLKMPNMDGLELIRELNRLEYNGKIIVASNFGEYELVREALLLGAVDYLLKISIKTEGLIEQLQKTVKLLEEEQQTLQEQVQREQVLRSNMKSVKNATLKDYFTNSYYDAAQLLQRRDIQLYLEKKSSYLFYIDAAVDRASENDNSNVSISFIENMILDEVESEHDVEIFQVDAHVIVVLIAKERLQQCGFEPLTFVQRIQNLLKMYMTLEPVIVYSDEVSGYVEAKETYNACTDAININFYERHSVLFNKEVQMKQDIEFVNYVDFSSALLQHVYEDDTAAVSSMLKAFTNQCQQNKIHPLALKTFLHKCLDYIPLCASRLIVLDTELYEDCISKIKACKSSDSLLTYAIKALDELRVEADRSSSPHTLAVKKEIGEVIKYVNLHYKDKITLEMIADYVNFSENYLCRVFREQMGTSLIHYINSVRMNKAADLIMKGHTYMKEVAALVGISDQFYFSRMFKKHFGVSPTDYRAHISESYSRTN